MTSVLVLLCLQGHIDPRFEKFQVQWKPEADPPFYAIRMKIEPYAYRSDVDVNWMRKQAARAYVDWQASPKDPKALFRAYLWQQVLYAAHFDSHRDEDRDARNHLVRSMSRWYRVPPSAEFSRLVCSAVSGDPRLKAQTIRLLKRYPQDGLLLYWTMEQTVFSVLKADDARLVRSLAEDFVKRNPDYWPAQHLWAVLPHMTQESTTMRDRLESYREMRKRMLALRPRTQEGGNKRLEIDFWLERLSRYIPAYEKLIKEGKGNVKLKGYRGDPP